MADAAAEPAPAPEEEKQTEEEEDPALKEKFDVVVLGTGSSAHLSRHLGGAAQHTCGRGSARGAFGGGAGRRSQPREPRVT